MTWSQLGNDIYGEAVDDEFGWSVSLNSAGNIVAVGADEADSANGVDSGRVRVYEFNSAVQEWLQMGQDLNGEAAGDDFGISVSLSNDGNILAVGAWLNDNDNGFDAGHVRVYQYNSAALTWTQLGQDIDGEAANDLFGWSVSLNSMGNVLAAGGNRNDGNGTDSGHVQVYRYNNTMQEWMQMGQDLNGEAAGDWFGYSVSLSRDGNILAVGGRMNNNDNGSDAGHVRVYQYNSTTLIWSQLGQDIDGEAADDWFGRSVSLNSAGNVLAAGGNGNDANGSNSGHVRVYHYDTTGLIWTRAGQDIDGEAGGDYSGYSVSLSGNGTAVAVGAISDIHNGVDSGHARVYTLN